MSFLSDWIFPKPDDDYDDVAVHRTKMLMPQSEEFRAGLYKAIKLQKISIQECQFHKLLKNPVVYQKKSESQTIIVFAELNYDIIEANEDLSGASKDVVLKISAGDKGDNSLTIERQIYFEIINRLYLGHYTPCVLLCVWVSNCTYADISKSISQMSDATFKTEFSKQFNKIKPSEYDKSKVDMVMMEKGNGIPLFTWAQKSHTIDEWSSVLFQICYTLAVFSFIGLKHADLHLDNILVQDAENTVDNYFIISTGIYYKVPIKYLVKLFDFDFGSFMPTSLAANFLGPNVKQMTNTKLNYFCKEYGICNTYNPKFDLFTVLSSLFEIVAYIPDAGARKYVKDFILSGVNEQLLKQPKGYEHRLCKVVGYRKVGGKDKGICDGDFLPDDTVMKHAITILTDSFDHYKNYITNFPQLSSLENVWFLEPKLKQLPQVKQIVASNRRMNS